jgi:propionate CoA-transferase
MGFRPAIAPGLRAMDARIFADTPMGLAADLAAKPARASSPRLS